MASTYDRAVMRAELGRDEGVRLRVYRCTAGKLTIGCGRNLDDVGIRSGEAAALGITLRGVIANGITSAQSDALLDGDIDAAEADLDCALPWWRRLDPVRQRVLLNMCFNLGIGRRASPGRPARGLLGFSNTLALIQSGQYAAAASNMLMSKWARQVGLRAVRLSVMMKEGAK